MSTSKDDISTPIHDTTTLINNAHDQINTLDEQIITLILQRITISAQIHQAHTTTREPRTNLSREMQILKRYRETLGKPGTTLSMALLELCQPTHTPTPKTKQPNAETTKTTPAAS